MPCYVSPPPYEGEKKKNAEEAVRILCAGITAHLRGQSPPHQYTVVLLEWFIEHRTIDRKIENDKILFYNQRYKAEAEANIARIDEDILFAQELLQTLKTIDNPPLR